MVRLFTVDPSHPVASRRTTRRPRPAACVYLKPRFGPFPETYVTNAVLCAYDFRIHDNVAVEGSAIYADEDSDESAAAALAAAWR